jgi:hypothetical protein
MTTYGEGDPRCLIEGLEDDLATAEARRNHKSSQSGLAIEALPTVYRGTTFRSALEASWAATLDALNIGWEYEPETVTLPSGSRYIPDFRLPQIGTWLEVKGRGVPRIEKAYEFSKSLACTCPLLRCECRWPGGELVLIGHPPLSFNPYADEAFDHWNIYALGRLARSHSGFANWSSARRRAAWLTTCPRCRQAGWFDLARCRACGDRLAGAQGYRPEDQEVAFTRISGSAAAAA